MDEVLGKMKKCLEKRWTSGHYGEVLPGTERAQDLPEAWQSS